MKYEERIGMILLLLGLMYSNAMLCSTVGGCVQLPQEKISRLRKQEAFLWTTGMFLAGGEIATGMWCDWNRDSCASMCAEEYVRPALWITFASSTATSLWNFYQGCRTLGDDHRKISTMKNCWTYLRRLYGSFSINTVLAAFITCDTEKRVWLLMGGGIVGAAIDTALPFANWKCLRKSDL